MFVSVYIIDYQQNIDAISGLFDKDSDSLIKAEQDDIFPCLNKHCCSRNMQRKSCSHIFCYEYNKAKNALESYLVCFVCWYGSTHGMVPTGNKNPYLDGVSYPDEVKGVRGLNRHCSEGNYHSQVLIRFPWLLSSSHDVACPSKFGPYNKNVTSIVNHHNTLFTKIIGLFVHFSEFFYPNLQASTQTTSSTQTH
jgi:hypothetical protein